MYCTRQTDDLDALAGSPATAETMSANGQRTTAAAEGRLASGFCRTRCVVSRPMLCWPPEHRTV